MLIMRASRVIELPLEEIKDILERRDDAVTRANLVAHGDRLFASAELLSDQLGTLDHYIEKGFSVPAVKGNRIVMINVAVDELERSRRFYEELLGVEFAEERHDDGPLHLNATFGEWNTPSWFLLSLWPDSDRAGATDFGFLVEDLDPAYEEALRAGGTDVHGPRNIEGMPRTAQIKDPSGNQVGLYQG
jgi:predicted enzyme related to lactoylglutathione lyase